MALEKDLELLDSYLGNRLNAEEKAAFEQALNANPALQRELNVQQQVVDGIRQARVAELKTMLNNVPVPAASGVETSALIKVLAGLITAGAIGTGLYLYFNQKDSTPEQRITQQEPAAETQEAPAPESQKPAEQETAQPQQTPEVADKPVAKNEGKTSPKKNTQAAPVTDEPAAQKPDLNVFDPSEEEENTTRKDEEAVVNGDAKAARKPSVDVTLDGSNKKYTFHYQFRQGKLYLYGSFEKNLYEIMEFFSDNKRTMFLYYKDNYYLLSEENEKIKPLKPINDPALLKKLKDYRGN